jgi:hypothetical protein
LVVSSPLWGSKRPVKKTQKNGTVVSQNPIIFGTSIKSLNTNMPWLSPRYQKGRTKKRKRQAKRPQRAAASATETRENAIVPLSDKRVKKNNGLKKGV